MRLLSSLFALSVVTLLAACTLTIKTDLQKEADLEAKQEETVTEESVEDDDVAEEEDVEPAEAADVAPVEDAAPVEEAVAEGETSVDVTEGAVVDSPVATEPRVISITAENWQFAPSVVVAKKGERVVLEITGLSGTHGFAVPTLGINQPVLTDQTVTVELPTDQPGSFDFFCSIPCGDGHADMRGQIVIEE
jgi:cytochrome c oxidase subunit 2